MAWFKNSWQNRYEEALGQDIKRLYQLFCSTKKSFKAFSQQKAKSLKNESPDEIGKLSADFSYLLIKWDVSEDQLPRVINALYYEALSFLILAITPWLSILTHPDAWQYWVASAIISPVLFASSAMRYWRQECLDRQQFVPFFTWVRCWVPNDK